MALLSTPAVDLWYERAGEGPPLLFVTGSGGDLRGKPNVFDSALPRHFDLVAYDHRGHGRSTDADAAPTMLDYAADAIAVLDAVGWTSTAVLGVSFGGMVAQEMAIGWPDRVDRLVLACTSSGGSGGASYPLDELQDLPDDERLRTTLGLSDTRYGPEWQAANPEECAALIEMAAAQRGSTVRRQLEARRHHDTADRLHRITTPTLVAAGTHDGIAPLANAEHLAAVIPGAQLRAFDGGHMFLVQDRTAFPAIADFLTAPAPT